MDRRRFLLTSLAGAFAPLAGEAQQAGKVWRVGIFATANPRVYDDIVDALRKTQAPAPLPYFLGADFVK